MSFSALRLGYEGARSSTTSQPRGLLDALTSMEANSELRPSGTVKVSI